MGDVLLQSLIAVGLISTLGLLVTRRLPMCIRWIGLQGVVLGLLPLFLSHEQLIVRVVIFVAISVLIKGVVFPWFLTRIVNKTSVTREQEALLGFPTMVFFGVLGLGVSFWLSGQGGIAEGFQSRLLMMTSYFLQFVGVLLIVSRRRAIMQVVGYLTLENGIYVFGSSLVVSIPFLVELGVLLDLFVAVFVMGFAVDRIRIEYASTDVTKLGKLKG